MGRPYTDGERKSGRCEIRTTPEEERMLNDCCKKLGKTRAEVLREGLRMVYETIK